ncbi:MAG: GntR family transcriptional regulator [Actinocatenispora sp.]
MRPARRPSLSDEVYESVKAQVMDHAIAPGARVNIDALARDLDVSPTPVREALARLEADGLMRKRPMSGYTTTPLLTRTEFDQLFEIRMLLEVPAAGLAAERADADPAGLTRLTDLAQLRHATVDASGYAGYAAFTTDDARLHELVAVLSGNPMLTEAIRRLHAHLHLHRLYLPGGPVADTDAEHQRVAHAIGAGDAGAARRAMREHLDNARTRHVAVFAEQSRHPVRRRPGAGPDDPGEE